MNFVFGFRATLRSTIARAALSATLAAAACSASATTVYQYTGNVFDEFEAPYGPTDFITATITLDAPITTTDRIDLQDFSGLAIEMSAGDLTLQAVGQEVARSTFTFNPDGTPFSWFLGLEAPDGQSLFSWFLPNDRNAQDRVLVDFVSVAGNISTPGSWRCEGDCVSPVPAVPIPAPLALMGGAIIALGFFRRPRPRRSNNGPVAS